MASRVDRNIAGSTVDVASRALLAWADHGASTTDPGPVVLASTLDRTDPAVGRALRAWLAGLRDRTCAHPGLFGGLAGQLAGLRLIATLHPAAGNAADAIATLLARGAREGVWATEHVGFLDYDLIGGPAGVLLAHCVHGPRDGELAPFAMHLATLCEDPELNGLRCRVYGEHKLLHWTQDRINVGLGHGVPGVAVALAAAVRADPADERAAAALRRVGRWLANEAYGDERGILTWCGTGRDGERPAPGAHPRQAWCYGAPGVAWSLWEASAALAARGTRTVAEELGDVAVTAMRSLCRNYDESFHLFGDTASDRLAICHGAAGVLAVADAFARWADLTEAAQLRDRLREHLEQHLDEVVALAPTNMRLLDGAAGVLAVLCSTAGASRDWMPLVALR
ncbi:lanthionine synthetase LanC family protein [Longimycelium tulufanense]|uniref:lanthionine synthetase LanC family protein n=1 Tax=Longimycelium tulufanense TaxID=907463 RepID=UPI001664CDAA|nr:lanthionine synthetase LanC family protein [Longimycelium tulufanense]